MTAPRPVTIRPARPADVPAMGRLTAESYHELDTRTFHRDWPDPVARPPGRQAAWERRTAHALTTDPEGCWVAERGDELVGCVVSRVRELMWVLSSFAVRVDLQGHGIGHQLLAAAMHHGRGCLRGMLAASADPGAVRRYRLAGFTLHPQMLLVGEVDRTLLPVVEHVRGGGPGDRDLLDSVDRRTRGAAHGPDHEVLTEQLRLLVVDRPTASGYAYVDETGSPALLAATSRGTATTLLWEALAASPAGTPVKVAHVTAANQWAVDVGLAARLSVHQSGYLGLRGMRPPAPYLHHGSLL